MGTQVCELANWSFGLWESGIRSEDSWPVYGCRPGGSLEPVGPCGLLLMPPSCLQVPRPGLSEARCLLLFAAALAAAATLGCTGLVAYTPVWCFPGATFAP